MEFFVGSGMRRHHKKKTTHRRHKTRRGGEGMMLGGALNLTEAQHREYTNAMARLRRTYPRWHELTREHKRKLAMEEAGIHRKSHKGGYMLGGGAMHHRKRKTATHRRKTTMGSERAKLRRLLMKLGAGDCM
jgi:hypothetical protein